MKIKENANIVLLGAWTLSILNPTFFANEFPELKIERDVPVDIELNTRALRFTVQKIIINPNKLIFFQMLMTMKTTI